MSVEKSCLIEVNIDKTDSPKKANLAIKLRLEQQSAAPAPSLEEIQLKLQKAELKRKSTLKTKNTLDKINQVQERKSRLEQNILDQKRETHYSKLETAEKLRVQLLTTKVNKAHEASKKIDRASQLRQEQEKTKEFKIQEKLSKVSQISQKDLQQRIIEKAKKDTEKVQKIHQAQKEKEVQKATLARQQIESKIEGATKRRDSVLQQVKSTAEKLRVNRSSSKDIVAPAEDKIDV